MRSRLSTHDLHRALMADVLLQQPDAGGSGGINSTAVRPDIGLDWPEGGADLPAQMLGDFAVLMPGGYEFTLPANLGQLWHEFTVLDNRPGSKTHNQQVVRDMLKFDKANPLIVASGPHSGMTLTCTMSTHPRPRGKKDDPKTAWVSDIAYLMAVSLADTRRPANTAEMKAIINSYAGKTIRLQSGLSGQCRPDAVIKQYYTDPTDLTWQAEGREARLLVLEDATGRKGCGARYYSRDFKNPAPTSTADTYLTEIQCDKQIQDPAGSGQLVPCNAVVRGWPQVDGFLPPLGGK